MFLFNGGDIKFLDIKGTQMFHKLAEEKYRLDNTFYVKDESLRTCFSSFFPHNIKKNSVKLCCQCVIQPVSDNHKITK